MFRPSDPDHMLKKFVDQVPGVEEEKHKAVMRILWANRFFYDDDAKDSHWLWLITIGYDMLVLLLLAPQVL